MLRIKSQPQIKVSKRGCRKYTQFLTKSWERGFSIDRQNSSEPKPGEYCAGTMLGRTQQLTGCSNYCRVFFLESCCSWALWIRHHLRATLLSLFLGVQTGICRGREKLPQRDSAWTSLPQDVGMLGLTFIPCRTTNFFAVAFPKGP